MYSCCRSGVEEQYMEREQLLDDVLDIWREKEIETSFKAKAKSLEVERKKIAMGMRATMLKKYKWKRIAEAPATGQTKPKPEKDKVEPAPKWLDIQYRVPPQECSTREKKWTSADKSRRWPRNSSSQMERNVVVSLTC